MDSYQSSVGALFPTLGGLHNFMKKIISLTLLFFTLNLFAQTAQLKGSNLFSGQNTFSNVTYFTSGGIIYSFDGQGRLTMTNLSNGAYSIQGTNGHYKSVDQYGNLREWTTNRFTIQISVGGVSKALVFSNDILMVDNAPVIENAQFGVYLPGLYTSAGFGNVPYETNSAGGGNFNFWGADGSFLFNQSAFGNAGRGNTNVMKVFAATNADLATLATTATTANAVAAANITAGTIPASVSVPSNSIVTVNGGQIREAIPSVSLTNRPAPTAAEVVAAGGLTNLSDAMAAYQELVNAGQAQYLADFVSFCADEGMTNATFRGSPLVNSNSTLFTATGAKFIGNSQISFNCNLQPTNTILINWSLDLTNANGGGNDNEAMFQCGNTTNFDSQFLMFNNNGWVNFAMANNTNCYPNDVVDVTNLMQFKFISGISFDWRIQRRHSTMISHDGRGGVTIWDNGNLVSFNKSGLFSLQCSNYPSSTNLNFFSVGKSAFTNGITSSQGGLKAVVESVFLFNKATDTNLLQAAIFASDWVQQNTKKRFWIFDSLGAQNSYTSHMGVKVDSLDGNSVIPFDYLQGGTTSQQAIGLTNTLILNRAHGKIALDEIEFGEGINDGGSLNAWTNAQILYNALGVYSIARVALDVWDVSYSATNATSDALTSISASNIFNLDAAFYTNRTIVRNDFQRSTLLTVDMMTTNRVPRLTADGLHFNDPTNGETAYWMVAGLWIKNRTGSNPYMLTNLPPYLVNGFGFTNAAQNTVVFTNFLLGSFFTNTSTRNELVVGNARCNPTTTGNALFALVTSPTGATYTTNSIGGMEADIIFTTAPHSWHQLTAQIPPGGIWEFLDKTGEGFVTMTNSYYQTLQ